MPLGRRTVRRVPPVVVLAVVGAVWWVVLLVSEEERRAVPVAVEELRPTAAVRSVEEPLCEFEADVDVAAEPGEEPAAVGATRESCCALCARTQWCAVGVLSSSRDDPPEACWLKRKAAPRVVKQGVVACVVGHRPSAADGDETPGKNREASLASALTESARLGQGHDYAIRGGDEGKVSAEELASRRLAIRGAVAHAWRGYAENAFGADAVGPVSGRAQSAGFEMAVTLVDALDTLKVVGLTEEFAAARAYVASEAFKAKLRRARGSFFETTIRVLGGLLGAHAVSETAEEARPFLEAAVILGDALFEKIDPSTGLVAGGASLRGGGCPSLAHSGTTQLEFAALSFLTGDPRYAERTMRFYDTVVSAAPNLDGLYPTCVGARSGKLTMGAEADSFYEYLLKTWLFTGQTDARLRSLYDAAVASLDRRLVSKREEDVLSRFLFVDNLDWRGGQSFSRDPAMEHLACFLPGWLALGASDSSSEVSRRRLALADEIAETCHAFYQSTQTRLPPERVKKHDLSLRQTDTREYVLRPEAAEGWWYLAEHPALPVDKYRNWGWDAFQACEKALRVDHGHASLRDVNDPNAGHLDRMESFWLAETLKYFYLLQDDSHLFPLDEFVFNTEAHPLRIPPQFRRPRRQES